MQRTQDTIPKALATYLQSSWDEMKKLDEKEGSCVHLGVCKLWMKDDAEKAMMYNEATGRMCIV